MPFPTVPKWILLTVVHLGCGVMKDCLSRTLLLCLSGHQEGRLDLSHPVHVDNCILEPETKQCWREAPAFTHRDMRYAPHRSQPLYCWNTQSVNANIIAIPYGINSTKTHGINVINDTSSLINSWFVFSGILYLNEDFEGGEFFFTKRDAKTVTVSYAFHALHYTPLSNSMWITVCPCISWNHLTLTV